MSYARFSVIAVVVALAGCSSDAMTRAAPYQPPPVGYSTYPGGSIFYTPPVATAPAAGSGVAASGSNPGALAPAGQSGPATTAGRSPQAATVR
jgi:hypothetical protein